MTLRRRSGKGASRIPQSAWDFSDCPNDLLWECWCHEFGRECPELIRLFRREWAAGNFATPKVVHVASEIDGNLRIFRLAEGFPDLSFLESKYETLRVQPVRRKANIDRALTMVADVALSGVMTAFPGEARAPGMGYVRLDFRHSKSALKKAVAQWIDLNWVKQEAAVNNMGRPKSERLKDDLNSLGAWRLLQEYNANQAAEETQRVPRKSGHEKPLFENPSEWSKARKRAHGKILEVRRWFEQTTA